MCVVDSAPDAANLREIERRLPGVAEDTRQKLGPWLERAKRIQTQQPKDKNKLYALHAPEVECIGKGKAHRAYAFGVKVPVATSLHRSAGGQFVAHIKSQPGAPYDGHTLAALIPEMEEQLGTTINRIIADRGYRGHNAPSTHQFKVYIAGQKRRVTDAIKRELRRRPAVEPVIGHLKEDNRMGRNFLSHAAGDAINAILAAAGYNFRRVLAWLKLLCAWFILLMTLNRSQNYQPDCA